MSPEPTGYIVTFTDLLPLPRLDGVPYSTVKLEEAALEAGPWAQIDEQSLAPLDTNPAEPILRTITTRKATLPSGYYRVVWTDTYGGQTAPSEPMFHALPTSTRPSVAEVASLLRARTKVRGGAEAGTFTTQTRPTADEVDDLIGDAMAEVLGKVTAPGAFTPSQEDGLAGYEGRVKRAVKLYAAVLIEHSYFPEQIGTGKSPADNYLKLYESRIRALIAEGEAGHAQGEGEGGAGGGGDSPADAAWAFPIDAGGQIGLNTPW